MAFATINGKDVLTALLSVPLGGTWRLDATVDAESAEGLTGDLTLSLDEGRSTWRCRAYRSADAFGRVELRAVGGAGGLAKVLEGQSYRQVTARVVVADLLELAGEQLDPTAEEALLSTLLPHWTRDAGLCSQQLARVVDALGAGWRVLPNGKVWLGLETWPSAPVFEYDVLRKLPADGRLELGAVQGYRLVPGQTFEGQRVGRVEHRVMPEAIRTSVWFDP